ncbi:hypothetical protein ES332_D06G012600v1 [Gossypium tomentosum]|uniref:Uncharacterized protein n=1 Tax=Gossypium tomentosum TaxID=34277 RepID=A0A5D2KCC0_GOSTO|nr:hypothetical protein ES332_D06G012600v1 [Gossypium tomentosum]
MQIMKKKGSSTARVFKERSTLHNGPLLSSMNGFFEVVRDSVRDNIVLRIVVYFYPFIFCLSFFICFKS